MSELLGKGLAVKINNAPWQRVVMHIDDDADTEAIVILYGLHPARTYDVELALVATEDLIRGKVSTEAASGMLLPDIFFHHIFADIQSLPIHMDT